MNKFIIAWLIISASFFWIVSECEADERGSSFPFISGDTFRFYCDYAFDDISRDLDPEKVKNKNTVFVKTDYLGDFFTRIHPKISSQYILVTHNSDLSISNEFQQYLEDDKIIAWFGQNVSDSRSSKIHPIPIGIANRQYVHGDIKIFKEMCEIAPVQEKTILLYMNFSINTNTPERTYAYHYFLNESFVTVDSNKDFKSYLMDLACSKFVLNPPGNGFDNHRTWECLLMRAIPVQKASPIDKIFEGLPIIIVNDWSEINEEFLNEKYEEINNAKFNMEKLYASYWLCLLDSFSK